MFSSIRYPSIGLGLIISVLSFRASAAESTLRVWEESLTLPTYRAGAPEKNPMFYFGRASQGAEGRVYPYPLYDTLTGEKVEQAYTIVYLENEYVRIGILPEIGGRIFEGIDKSNGYHFFYRQHVIKPALIGLIGAWISGGVEWNIPHHHRATTFIPVQHRVVRNPDGSATVWVGELELRHRMRWAVGYTLRPGNSCLEASIRIINRTPLVQTMLCFANVAVHANEQYQVIFPPRTQYVTHHHKREFTTWPVATGHYGGWDFGDGTDVSWYKNHVAANSMFAWKDEGDFLAGYDHGREAGLLSVADRHAVPGKKLWTWGNGPRGRMWDKILTDEDGPYIELMVGAYSDNQPDYSWLQPFETKRAEIVWYPFRRIGGVKNATREAAVNLRVESDRARLGFHTTAAHRQAVVRLLQGERELVRETVSIDPAKPYAREIPLAPGTDALQLKAELWSDHRLLVDYTPVLPHHEPLPAPVTPPAKPQEIATQEELYAAGLRVEQFHHPTLDPEPFWEEALRRDPSDTRVNTALAIRLLKAARFEEAESLLDRAVERASHGYTAPREGEPFYYRALARRAQGRMVEAAEDAHQAAWSLAWKGASYFLLAEIASSRGDFSSVTNYLARALEAGTSNLRAWTLKAAALRHLDRAREAAEVLAHLDLDPDPLEPRVLAERWLLKKSPEDARTLLQVLEAHPAALLEIAAEYLNAGLWSDGTEVLEQFVGERAESTPVSPLVYYYLASFADRLGNTQKALRFRQVARAQSPDYVFPFQSEAIAILQEAMDADATDPRAPYYLGNLLFDWQPAEAVRLWENAAILDASFPLVHRNLAIAYAHRPSPSLEQAIARLEKAVSLPNPYPLHFAELDELYEAAGHPPEKRLALLSAHEPVVALRDDALSRLIALQVVSGSYDNAISRLTGRPFNVWEGGSLSVARCWVDAHLLRGHQHRKAGRHAEALADYDRALTLPDHLPSESRAETDRQVEAAWWKGFTHAQAGSPERAQEEWTKAAEASPGNPEQRYYRGCALQRLGRETEARELFQKLLETGRERLTSPEGPDYFASFDDRQSRRVRLAEAHYWVALGHTGLGEPDSAKEELEATLKERPDHLGALSLLQERP